MKAVVSRLKPEDAHCAAEVMLQFAGIGPTPGQLAAYLAADAHYFLVAWIAQAPVGFAYAYELPRPDGATMLFLSTIEVLPRYRRRGVATAMLSYLCDVVDQRCMKELFVIADRSNEQAISFYSATGGVVERGESLCFVYPARS